MTLAAQPSDARTTEFDTYLQAHTDLGRFGGAVLIVRDGEPLFSDGYGMASLEHHVPNTPQTKFRLGSVTKQFTAAAILHLQDQGRLEVHAPVSTYLPDYPNGDRITLHHLLTHTAGIPNMTSFPDYTEWMKLPTILDEVIARFQDLPLEFEPGAQYAYSNSGYVLLTQVIEAVSGQSYADYLADHIFTPLGMDNTGYEHPLAVIDGMASGYQPTDNGYQEADYINMDVPQGAGSLYSTVGDLARWNQFLFGGDRSETVLNDAAIAAMTTPQASMNLEGAPQVSYGYGLVINDYPDGRRIGHGGGINGFATSLVYISNEDMTVAVLSNVQGANPEQISRDLVAIALGEPYDMPSLPEAVTVNPAVYDRYVGTYQVTPEFQVEISVENEQLYLQGTGQARIALYPASETEYFSRVVDRLRIIFNAADNGSAESLTLIQNGVETVAPRVN